MAMFNSKLLVYQKVNHHSSPLITINHQKITINQPPIPRAWEVLLMSARVLLVDFLGALPRPLTACPYDVLVEATVGRFDDQGLLLCTCTDI